MSCQNAKEHIKEIVSKYPSSVLATIDDNGFPCLRIMYTVMLEDDMTLYYMTSKTSRKCRQIDANSKVAVQWTNPETWECVDYRGNARITGDIILRKKLWNDEFNKYFTGIDDPNLAIIEIKPETVICVCDMGQCVEQLDLS